MNALTVKTITRHTCVSVIATMNQQNLIVNKITERNNHPKIHKPQKQFLAKTRKHHEKFWNSRIRTR